MVSFAFRYTPARDSVKSNFQNQLVNFSLTDLYQKTEAYFFCVTHTHSVERASIEIILHKYCDWGFIGSTKKIFTKEAYTSISKVLKPEFWNISRDSNSYDNNEAFTMKRLTVCTWVCFLDIIEVVILIIMLDSWMCYVYATQEAQQQKALFSCVKNNP